MLAVMADALIGPMGLFVIAAICASLPAWLAHERGRSAVIWGALGIVAPLVSILFVILLGQKKSAAAY